MTTTVLIAHKGPPTHDVMVQRMDGNDNVTLLKTLKAGEFTEQYMWDTNLLLISEVPPADAKS